MQHTMNVFAEKLKQLRGTESQASFAQDIGINRVQYAKYEKGANSPSVEVLERICRIHAVSADWLLGLKENSTSVTAGPGAAVAIGTNARATKITNLSAVNPKCKACPKAQELEKLKKTLASLLGKQS